MRNLKIISLVVGCAVLQLSFFGAMRPFGIVPNLAIILIASLCSSLGDGELVLLSAALGIIFDLSSGADFGLRATFFILFSLALLVVRQIGADFGYLPSVLVAIVLGSLAYNAAIVASLMAGGQAVVPGYYSLLALREIGVDMVLAVLIWPIVSKSTNEQSSGQLIRRV